MRGALAEVKDVLDECAALESQDLITCRRRGVGLSWGFGSKDMAESRWKEWIEELLKWAATQAVGVEIHDDVGASRCGDRCSADYAGNEDLCVVEGATRFEDRPPTFYGQNATAATKSSRVTGWGTTTRVTYWAG